MEDIRRMPEGDEAPLQIIVVVVSCSKARFFRFGESIGYAVMACSYCNCGLAPAAMACSFVPRLRLSHSSTRLRGSSKERALCRLSEFMPRSNGLPSRTQFVPVSYSDASARVIKRERLICLSGRVIKRDCLCHLSE
ncbi:hypothetical protein DFP75_108135 [Marinomonas alcarazii]|uniref:Uncharacterized protein n=1 Tax=Marinomonas alcarazii TaxID=491949 RepID=A0A318UT20_9GAMM|nr:hypothetical protein DFP75_108135 [Marinomonas alcarazii]